MRIAMEEAGARGLKCRTRMRLSWSFPALSYRPIPYLKALPKPPVLGATSIDKHHHYLRDSIAQISI